MSHYILAVDVGNSRIKFGLFNRNDSTVAEKRLPRCLHAAAVVVDSAIPWEEICCWEELKNGKSVAGVAAGSNPDGVNKVVSTWPTDGWKTPQVIHDPDGFPMAVNLDAPEKVGIDRLLNAVAANGIRPENCEAVIVDCGTATTVDLVSADGTFQGGAILPGFELASRSLHAYTALLPFIPIEELAAEKNPVLGKNTTEAIRSGLFWGQLGAVKELIDRLTSKSAIRNPQSAMVLLTGGGAGLLDSHLPDAQWEPHLALQGLVLVTK